MTVSLYPPIVMQNDLSPDQGYGSDIDNLCQEIIDATKGWGTNKDRVVRALATQDATRRYQIAKRFEELSTYNSSKCKTLQELMKKEFSGNLGKALEFLSLPSDEAECAMIHYACKGIGSSVNIVWSIVCGRTNAEMEKLKKTYYRKYDKDLGKLLASELHGDLEHLVFNCMQAAEEVYDRQFHTKEKAVEDAETIHDKGQGRWGTDEKGIFKILCRSPKEHLENVDKVYSDKYGYTLMKSLEKELGGMLENNNVKNATLYMLGMKLKPYETMAKLIKSACAGIGTDELLLTCCLIRFQTVFDRVQSTHIELFQKSVHDRVRSEVSGKYRDLLLSVCNTAWPEQ